MVLSALDNVISLQTTDSTAYSTFFSTNAARDIYNAYSLAYGDLNNDGGAWTIYCGPGSTDAAQFCGTYGGYGSTPENGSGDADSTYLCESFFGITTTAACGTMGQAMYLIEADLSRYATSVDGSNTAPFAYFAQYISQLGQSNACQVSDYATSADVQLPAGASNTEY